MGKLTEINNPWRRLAAVTGLVLLVPLTGSFISQDVQWTWFDYFVAGLLVYTAGTLYIYAGRRWPQRRPVILALLAAAFIYIWAELAVGVFTDLGS